MRKVPVIMTPYIWIIILHLDMLITTVSARQRIHEDNRIIIKPQIHIAGLLPLTDDRNSDKVGVGRGILLAIELALEHVNNDKNYLHGYNLNLVFNDTKCDMAVGTKLFFDMMRFDPQKVILFGDACSNVTAPIAESSKWWNIWQVSYADTNPLLSERKTYPNFYRTVPSDINYNPARMALLRRFGWNRVGTLFQDASKGSARYAYAHNKLTTLLDDNEAILRQTQSFSSDPKPALAKFKEKDIRIIIGNFDEHMARRVFCSAYQEGMYGYKYGWIILGDYSANWWNVTDPSVSCTPAQLKTALNYYIATDVMTISKKKQKTISGITPQRYMRMFKAANQNDYPSKFHGYAYDGIWTIAVALDKIIKENAGVFYFDDFRSEKMANALNDTNFFGVTGQVLFSSGDRLGGIVYKQFIDGKLHEIGEYNFHNSSMKMYRKFKWQGVKPPIDRSLREVLMYRINVPIYVSMCTLAGLGVILAMFFLIINVVYRNHRYIKMSSPNMNNVVIAGCILAYISVFLLGTDGGLVHGSYHYMCYARIWTLCLAFTLAFGAMFSKTWRVHAIFTNIKMNRKVIKDYQLFIVVAVLLCIDVILLLAWMVLDPMRRGESKLEPEIKGGFDKEIIFVVEYCISNRMSMWLGVLYAYKGLLLVVGCFLAWETRQVSIPALNDSKYIGMSVYNIVTMCVAGVAVSFVVKDKPDSGFLIIALFIIFCTTITLCLVFVPKVIELKIDPRGDEWRLRATLRKSITMSSSPTGRDDITDKITALTTENNRYRQILDQKKQEIEELLCLLGEDLDGEIQNPEPEEDQFAHCVNTPLLYKDDIDGRLQEDQCSLISNSSGANVWSPDEKAGMGTTDEHGIVIANPGAKERIELTEFKSGPSCDSLTSYEGLKQLRTNNMSSLRETDIVSDLSCHPLPDAPRRPSRSSEEASIHLLFQSLAQNIDKLLDHNWRDSQHMGDSQHAIYSNSVSHSSQAGDSPHSIYSNKPIFLSHDSREVICCNHNTETRSEFTSVDDDLTHTFHDNIDDLAINTGKSLIDGVCKKDTSKTRKYFAEEVMDNVENDEDSNCQLFSL